MPVNGGTYRAKNFGMSRTDAELITFMDSDDWSHPQRIAQAVDLLAARPEAVAVCHHAIRIQGDGLAEFRGRASRIAPITLMVRRRTLDRVGFFDSVRVSADAEMLARIRSGFGGQALLVQSLPSLFMARRDDSLSGGGSHAIGWRGLTGDRLQYKLAFRAWHRRCKAENIVPFMPRKPVQRPFPAPESFLPVLDASPSTPPQC
jgi:glycosyltransferase involved in cell wall biosynthesis